MRQAGRILPPYRQLKEEVGSLERMFRDPEIATEVTLMPVDMLGVDAAILFADIFTPVDPMGCSVTFNPGPVLEFTISEPGDVARLQTFDADSDLSYVADIIGRVRSRLPDSVPLIGFAGAPFTLASYMIEGGSSRNFALTKSLMYSDPAGWERLMAKILEVLVPYAANQVACGADVIQIFDSWVGALGPEDYKRYVLPHSRMLIRQIQTTGVPVIHFATGAGTFLPLLHEAGGDVLGIDWRVRLDEAWSAIRHEAAMQGNLDPAALFAPLPAIKRRVEDILRRAGNRPGYIFNLGHGILPETPVENVKAVVRMVRDFQP